ncbi:DUF2097 domain-containing protein [Methanobrevibacter sp. DSM 116169]|uniref:DUF2097 domain-containing protein n=1 Tax=Methanobrevibacter sp. DSM 116169 TaxID=3242727 RepID=UPI0038FCBEF1
MTKEISLTYDEAMDYIKNNVNVGDILEVSYNRIFAPGEVLAFIEPDEVTGEGFRINLHLMGEVLSQAVVIDFKEIKDDLLEFRHIPDDDGEETVVEISD